MTFGSKDTALMLYHYYEGCPDMAENKRAPKGFSRVGAGAYRTAILDKSSNLVYKIGSYYCNTNEAGFSRKLRKRSTRNLGFDLYIPRSRTFRVPRASVLHALGDYPECVAVQEYAERAKPTVCGSQEWLSFSSRGTCNCGRNPCHTEVQRRVIDWAEMCDVHYNNLLIVDNTYWLIDLGEDG